MTDTLIRETLGAGRRTLTEPETKTILRAYAIPVPRFEAVKDRETATVASASFSYPLALKVISRELTHKSEAGGVVLGIQNAKDIEDGLFEIMLNVADDAPQAIIEGFLIEEMAPRGVEVIVGALRDPVFGPAVMFGTGGLAVEILKDVTFALSPIDREDAFEMMNEVKGFGLLTGARGGGFKDLDAIADVIMKVSRIMEENVHIMELEINPLIVYRKGVLAVDARATLSVAV
ncbi:MAG: acetate--CoA ligase family protein [Deltaproteobacteria bacterium]